MTADPSPRPRPIWTDETELSYDLDADHSPACHRGTIPAWPGQLDPAHCERCRTLLRRISRRSGPPNLDSCPAGLHAARAVADLHNRKGTPQ